jgi:polyisoprenoid-binding protein YceI
MKYMVHLMLVCALMLMSRPQTQAAIQDPAASALTAELTVKDGFVAVLCPLTIGGNFEAKTSALTGELVLRPDQPGAVAGALSVDLRTLQTGIRLRDEHMRTNYLEVHRGPKYAEATLSRIQLEGADLARPTSTARFRGILTLHGEDQEVAGTADIRHAGGGLRVKAKLPVRTSLFQIPAPSYLGVGVKDEVIVDVSLQIAAPAAVPEPIASRH